MSSTLLDILQEVAMPKHFEKSIRNLIMQIDKGPKEEVQLGTPDIIQMARTILDHKINPWYMTEKYKVFVCGFAYGFIGFFDTSVIQNACKPYKDLLEKDETGYWQEIDQNLMDAFDVGEELGKNAEIVYDAYPRERVLRSILSGMIGMLPEKFRDHYHVPLKKT